MLPIQSEQNLTVQPRTQIVFPGRGIFVQARLINMLIGRATIIRNKLMTTATLASEESSAL
jgi:hypothetical protein